MLSTLRERLNLAAREFIVSLITKMPARMKRMMFFASLIARIRNTSNLDMETAHSLNTALNLANSDTSLMLPAMMSEKIWSSVPGIEEVIHIFKMRNWATDKLNDICKKIVDIIPDFLVYSSKKRMQEDVECLIRQHPDVLLGV